MTARLKLAVVACTIAPLVACSSGPSAPDDSAYIEELEAARADKDLYLEESTDTPVPEDRREALLPLPYYPINPNYAVPAALSLASERPVFEMPTSTGTIRRMQLIGVLEFSLLGESRSLGAFVPEGTQQITRLFVPFADLTTGDSTYSAGRYLDIDTTTTGYYTIDFNQAYNPYCAYNNSYECPYPPPPNRLNAAVLAGEQAPAG